MYNTVIYPEHHAPRFLWTRFRDNAAFSSGKIKTALIWFYPSERPTTMSALRTFGAAFCVGGKLLNEYWWLTVWQQCAGHVLKKKHWAWTCASIESACVMGMWILFLFSRLTTSLSAKRKRGGGKCAFSYANTQAAVRSNEAPLLPIIPCTFVSGKCPAVLEWFVTNLHPRTFCRHSRKLLYLLSRRTGTVLAAGNSFMRIPLQACVVRTQWFGLQLCRIEALICSIGPQA